MPSNQRRIGLRAPARAAGRRVDDRFFRSLVSSLSNGVLAITRDGTVAQMNAEAHRVFQVKLTPSAIGRPFLEVLGDHPDVVRVLNDAFELKHLPDRNELRLGSTGKVIGYTLSHVRDERDLVIGLAFFFKDLTRVEQMEERDRLRDRLVALGEMAAAIAHEVKNPLAGIEVLAGVLKRQLTDADAQSILNDIIGEAKMANQILGEALEFVRPLRLEVERTSLIEVLHTSVALADGKVPRREIVLHEQLAANLPPISGDRHQLCQVFTNLLINAFEALEGKGVVHLTAWEGTPDEDGGAGSSGAAPPPRTVVVEIADNGPGVPDELANRIFNAFFTTKPQGSGLGLAVVRKIVDAHDGRIDIETGPRGTRFRVILPVSGATDWLASKSLAGLAPALTNN